MSAKRILFVCLGNICRSPTAQGVMEKVLQEAELVVEVDSAGTGGWHVGQSPDPRASRAAAHRGVDLSTQRARQVSVEDFRRFDLILAMDESNLEDLQRMAPAETRDRVRLFLDFHPDPPVRSVPDPYYGGENGFEDVLDLVEAACRGLLAHLEGR